MATSDLPWRLSPRFEEALVYATHVHEGHLRKGTTIPYVAHLLAVCALVLEDGGTEEEAIAALLHDAAEDAGGAGRLAGIRQRFGERVAAIVAGCSDTDQVPKPPWKVRKERYIAHLTRHADASTRRVSLADKVHNARAILRDYRVLGEQVWSRFNAPAEEQVWYYRALIEAFRQRGSGPLLAELEQVVDELERRLRNGSSHGTGGAEEQERRTGRGKLTVDDVAAALAAEFTQATRAGQTTPPDSSGRFTPDARREGSDAAGLPSHDQADGR